MTLELANSEENRRIRLCEGLYVASEARVAGTAQETASQDASEHAWYEVFLTQFTFFEAKDASLSWPIDFHHAYLLVMFLT